MHKVESSLFIVSLDHLHFDSETDAFFNFLIADEGGNRWYDKAVQIFVNKDRTCGFYSDCTETNAALGGFLMQEMSKVNDNDFMPASAPAFKPHFHNLEFDLNEELKAAIDPANDKHKQAKKSVKFSHMNRKNVIDRKNKIFPDFVMQCAFQAALSKLHGRYVPMVMNCFPPTFKNGSTSLVDI